MTRSGLALVTAAVIALAAPPADAGRGTPLLKYLPDTTTMIVVVDVAHARGTPMFKKGLEIVRGRYAWWEALDKSGVAVEKLVDTVMVGGATSGDRHVVAVLDGKVDKLAAEVKKASTKTETHGGVAVWTLDDGEVAVIDKRLVFATTGDMAAVIDRAQGKAKSAASGNTAARTRDALAAATPKTDVFGGVVLDSALRGQAKDALGSEAEWMTFSVTSAAKLTFDAKLQLADDAAAGKAVTVLQGRLAGVRDTLENFIGKDFADSIAFDQVHAIVRISATMTAEEVEKVLGVFRMWM
jgi:hypothetical protein